MSDLPIYLGLAGSLLLAAPSIRRLARRRDFQQFMDTFDGVPPEERDADKLWRAVRDGNLIAMLAWDRTEAVMLALGGVLLFLSFLAQLWGA